MHRIATRLEVGILILLGTLLLGRAAAGTEAAQAQLPVGIADALSRREYEATRNARGLQAPNRAHGLRTYFERSGIRVHDRTAVGSPELFGLTLDGVGRGSALTPVASGEVAHEGAHVEIRRPGLVEWFVNSDAGLEQGFILAERPRGAGELVLELALSDASATSFGDDLVFATRAGRRLRYGALQVVDATGRVLPARFELSSPHRVRIALDDAGASYPIVIDPLLTETADAQVSSGQGLADFGKSVAAAGDVNGDGFEDAIVGAPWYDAGQSDEGAAFVFLGSASGIPSGNPGATAVRLESDQAVALFGWSVAGAGDVNGDGYGDVIVGALFYSAGESSEGAAFVFLGSATGIAPGGPATAARLESDQEDAHLGTGVAGAGDVNGDGYADVIVSSEAYDAGQTDEGAAFVFLGSATGVASGNPATAAAQLESDQANALLGFGVAGAGDVNGDGYADLIVSANEYDAGQTDEGAAFVFLGSASGIASGNPATAAAQLETDQASSRFGSSVAGAGDVNGDGYADVIVGTPANMAWVYHGGAQGILDGSPANAPTQLESNQAEAQLGYSVAGAGDVNGDGYSDVIVGASFYDAGQTDEGAAFVFHGSASGIADGSPANAAAQLESDQADSLFGASVAGAGDVNGDGYADVIVGAYAYDSSELGEGAAFVFLGSATGVADGTPTTAAAQLEANQANAAFGLSVASAGDVNGDGYADVIVGANGYQAPESQEGAAFVFLGSATGIADGNPTAAATQLESNQVDAHLGDSVAGAGDVNGDGFADVIVGAGLYDAGNTNEGAAFVFHGSASGITDGNPSTASARLESDQDGAELGFSVAGAGDVDGDGFADVIVGARLYDNGNTDEGAAFVFRGASIGIGNQNPAGAAFQLEADQDSSDFGRSVAGAGDVNGDGYSDVIVGAYFYDAGEANEGAAFLFLGSAGPFVDGNPTTAAAQLESDQAHERLGYSVARAGDVDGDGFADVIVGAYGYTVDQSNEGIALVFTGGGNQTGRRVLARQLRGGGSTLPVQPWGASYDIDDFQVRATATHPLGRGRVKLQIQTCPVAVPMGHASCTTSTSPGWTDVTASGNGVTLAQSVTGLADDTLRRWRARILYAPYTVTQAGITAPPNPAHGPWRRLFGQAVEADLRIRLDSDGDGTSNGSDPDDDGDGLLDLFETDTGTYVSPTNTGTDPLDADSDDDGLQDGPEVALGVDPNDPDTDDDADLDGADNCPFIVNPDQTNGDAHAAGDACQCGDVTGDGIISTIDYTRARELVAGRTPSGAAEVNRCDVTGDADCRVEDLAVLDRLVDGAPATIVYGCDAYTDL